MTKFFVKDERNDEDPKFKYVSRKVYKLTARKNSEQGLPIRTGVEYHDGVPIKMLTLLRKTP
jgi:hypothetical protein